MNNGRCHMPRLTHRDKQGVPLHDPAQGNPTDASQFEERIIAAPVIEQHDPVISVERAPIIRKGNGTIPQTHLIRAASL